MCVRQQKSHGWHWHEFFSFAQASSLAPDLPKLKSILFISDVLNALKKRHGFGKRLEYTKCL